MNFALARYTITGTLDTSFGTNGIVTTDFSVSSSANSSEERMGDVAIQPDGKIIVSGSSGEYFAAARYNADGSLDTTFGTGGKVNTLDVNFPGHSYALVLQNAGKIVLVGQHYEGMGTYNGGLVRYKGLEFYLPIIIR